MIKYKILIIEDELKINETITELLTLKNYEVQSATNGQEALDILDYWHPDLIISDIMMPVMDGLELHSIIRESKALTAIPFIFLTAKKSLDLKRNCILEGADDFISKPFKAVELLELIASKISKFDKIKNSQNNLYIGEKTHFLNEMNLPIEAIFTSITELIKKEKVSQNDDITSHHHAIKTSVLKLKRNVQNIALYENNKNNTFQINSEAHCEIKTVFSKVTKSISKDYKCEVKPFIDKSYLKISEEHLHFILWELVDNALKFSANSKKMTIRGKKYDAKHYAITVEDFGVGISETELKKINAAEQFNRELHHQNGLGLGLYLSKIITRKHSGIFGIVSKKDVGTVVTVILPLIEEKTAAGFLI